MDELLVECSIHLDGVPLKDVRTFKCGHGFCTTCIDTLFSGPPPFKCPTCRKRIQRRDGLQIFLNPHRLLSQSRTQSPCRGTNVDIDLTVSDDLTAEPVNRGTRQDKSLFRRVEHLQRQVFDVNKEHDALKASHRALKLERDAIEAQHAALKSHFTDLESQRNALQHLFTDLQIKYEAATSDAQHCRQDCKKARAEASAMRKEKEKQDEAMSELAEREREFRHRAHANKLAYDKYKRKCDALRQELEHIQRIQQTADDPEDQSLLVVDRDAPDNLDRAPYEAWLDEVCEVQGDRLDVDSNYADDSGKENIHECEELQPGPTRRATESVDDRDRPLPEDRPRPAAIFRSEWNLESDRAVHKKVRETKKRKNREDAVMGAPSGKVVKVSAAWKKVRGSEEKDNPKLHHPSSSKQMQSERSPRARRAPTSTCKTDQPLNFDSRGNLKGAVVLGPRRRFDKTP